MQSSKDNVKMVWVEMAKSGCDERHHEEAMMKVVGVFEIFLRPSSVHEASASGGPRPVTCTGLLIPSSTGQKGVLREGTISRERGAANHVA